MSTSKLSTADCVHLEKKSAICVRVMRFILKTTNVAAVCLDAARRPDGSETWEKLPDKTCKSVKWTLHQSVFDHF